MPDYTLNMAFHSINFWLIIFAGFIVYLIWGFVFSFVMEALGKMDKVKIAIEEKNKEIKDAELELKDFEVQIDKMTHTKAEFTKEMNKLKRIIENAIIPDEFEHDIFAFSTGWISFMKQGGKSKEEIEDANIVTHEFVKITLHSWEPINAN
ncbi:MAG TPA: hypothetical protein VMW01_00260 [Williamwhitmania sp.]|nr:hypothetical protein [Williamwhitmania sp.]